MPNPTVCQALLLSCR